jgi:hypothetical protein
MSAAAMANWAAGNSGVGPGVNKRVLRIIFCTLLALNQKAVERIVNHRIHIYVVFVNYFQY